MRKANIAVLALASLAGAGLVWADDLDDAYQALKEAQTAKNADDVLKWAPEAAKLARAIKEENRLEYAKQVDQFAEYSLYATLAGISDAAKQVALGDALLDLNAKSQYVAQMMPGYLAAADKLGGEKALAAGRKALAAAPNNEDVLFFMMTKQPAQAGTYATRLINAMNGKAKPEGLAEADWEKKKNLYLGRGYYVAGTTACAGNGWAECDRHLRAAIPYVGKDPQMGGTVYFYLGLANYNLGKVGGIIIDRTKVQQAQKYSEQAAAMPGPMQANAARNAQAMRQELAGPRR
jgi:hypothetical protein